MGLVGLETVKQKFLDILSNVELRKRQGVDHRKFRYHTVFQGNPGTGKTTVARIYAKFLQEVGVLETSKIVEISGTELAYGGPKEINMMIQNMLGDGGGVIFVDEAYQAVSSYSGGAGKQALDVLLTAIENNIGRLVLIVAGYKKDMEDFFNHNEGLPSRIPNVIHFDDFADHELWAIFRDNFNNGYDGRMKIEGGIDGLYARVALRRIGRGRGIRGFGNARTVENFIKTATERQARRLQKERDAKVYRSSLYLTKEDLIGLKPYDAMSSSVAWKRLQDFVGLEDVKNTVRSLFDMLATNYHRELAEQKPLHLCLNRVFLGRPGTGKTTVAEIYGEIMVDLGLLSKGEVVVKKPADFIGECLGKSEAKTRTILASTLGKVLVIDESYAFDTGGDNQQSDTYRKAVVDTLVAEIQGIPGDDRCVLMLGYEDKMKRMFQNVNEGLARRFNIENPFRFMNYSTPELMKIMDLKLRTQEMKATSEALDVVKEMLGKAQMRPTFANASEIDAILDKAKLNYQMRQSRKPVDERDFDTILLPGDFDPDYTRRDASTNRWKKSLEGKVSEAIINRLARYQKLAQMVRNTSRDPHSYVPTRFVFKGPPGTGKTTAARAMGKVMYDIGFLATDEVVECSSSDLIGQCVGHTGPKTIAKLESALGKVLFLDEAYRLGEGEYAKEAVNELIYQLTTPKYDGKIVIILAGYGPDINRLMSLRPGLSGLFPEEITFGRLSAVECLSLLSRELKEERIGVPFLQDTGGIGYKRLHMLLRALSLMPSWNNARDVKTLAQDMVVTALEAAAAQDTSAMPALQLTAEQAIDCASQMVELQRNRCLEQRQYNTRANSHGSCGSQNPGVIDQTRQYASSVVQQTSAGEANNLLGCDDPQKCDISGAELATSTLADAAAGVTTAIEAGVEEEDDYERRRMKKLQQIGGCVNGFEWCREGDGYRCAGGEHYVSDSQLGVL